MYRKGEVVKLVSKRPRHWNGQGEMDSYLGKIVILTADSDAGTVVFKGQRSWSFNDGDIERYATVDEWSDNFSVKTDGYEGNLGRVDRIMKESLGIEGFDGFTRYYNYYGIIDGERIGNTTTIEGKDVIRFDTVDAFAAAVEKDKGLKADPEDYELFKVGDFVVVTKFRNSHYWKDHWFDPGEVLKLGGQYWKGSIKGGLRAFTRDRVEGGGMSYRFNEGAYEIRFATETEIAASQFTGAAKNWKIQGWNEKFSADRYPEKSALLNNYTQDGDLAYLDNYQYNQYSFSGKVDGTMFTLKQLQKYILPQYSKGEKTININYNPKTERQDGKSKKNTDEICKASNDARDGRKSVRNARKERLITGSTRPFSIRIANTRQRTIARGTPLSNNKLQPNSYR